MTGYCTCLLFSTC